MNKGVSTRLMYALDMNVVVDFSSFLGCGKCFECQRYYVRLLPVLCRYNYIKMSGQLKVTMYSIAQLGDNLL